MVCVDACNSVIIALRLCSQQIFANNSLDKYWWDECHNFSPLFNWYEGKPNVRRMCFYYIDQCPNWMSFRDQCLCISIHHSIAATPSDHNLIRCPSNKILTHSCLYNQFDNQWPKANNRRTDGLWSAISALKWRWSGSRIANCFTLFESMLCQMFHSIKWLRFEIWIICLQLNRMQRES